MSKSKFLGASGLRLIKQLFIEHAAPSEDNTPSYAWAREDKEINGVAYPSLYRLYMEEYDVTEGAFVEKYLYDWDHWEQLSISREYANEISNWRKELRASIMSNLMGLLMEDSMSRSKTAISTTKYLVDKLDGKRPVGKPKTSSLSPLSEKEALTDISEDVKRLRLINS